VAGDPRIGRAGEPIRRALAAGVASVSIISVWELGMLDAKGRISLSIPCEAWVDAALARTGLHLTGLTPAIALAASRLPGTLHGDPADRIIAATARALDATLITSDRRLLDYCEEGHLRARAL
jgi:PIN domain nuclease of toxin-antitoxin system